MNKFKNKESAWVRYLWARKLLSRSFLIFGEANPAPTLSGAIV